MSFDFVTATPTGLALNTSAFSLPFSFSAIGSFDILNNGTLMSLGDNGAGNQYHQLRMNTSGFIQAISRAGGTSSATHATSISTGELHQYGGRFASENREPCLDGVMSGVNTTLRTPTTNRVALGVIANNTDGAPVDGQFQEFGIWNIELSDDDFAQLGELISPLMVRPEALAFYLEGFNTDFTDKMARHTLGAAPNAPSSTRHFRVQYPSGVM